MDLCNIYATEMSTAWLALIKKNRLKFQLCRLTFHYYTSCLEVTSPDVVIPITSLNIEMRSTIHTFKQHLLFITSSAKYSRVHVEKSWHLHNFLGGGVGVGVQTVNQYFMTSLWCNKLDRVFRLQSKFHGCMSKVNNIYKIE